MRSKGQRAIAKRLGVSQTTIHRRVRAGKLRITKTPAPAAPSADMAQQEVWHAERIAAQTPTQERRIKDLYGAKMAKLEYERAIGKLVEAEQVAAEWGRIAQRVRDQLLSLPQRLAPLLLAPIREAADDRAALVQAAAILKREISAALAGLTG